MPPPTLSIFAVPALFALTDVANAQAIDGEVTIEAPVFELSESFDVVFEATHVSAGAAPVLRVLVDDVDITATCSWSVQSSTAVDQDQDGVAEAYEASFDVGLPVGALAPGNILEVDVETSSPAGLQTWSDASRVRSNVELHGSTRLRDGDTCYDVALLLHEMEHLSGAYFVSVNGVDVSPLIGVYDERVIRDDGVAPYSRRKFSVASLDFSAIQLVPTDQVTLAYSATAAAGTSSGSYSVREVVPDTVNPGVPQPCPESDVQDAMDALDDAEDLEDSGAQAEAIKQAIANLLAACPSLRDDQNKGLEGDGVGGNCTLSIEHSSDGPANITDNNACFVIAVGGDGTPSSPDGERARAVGTADGATAIACGGKGLDGSPNGAGDGGSASAKSSDGDAFAAGGCGGDAMGGYDGGKGGSAEVDNDTLIDPPDGGVGQNGSANQGGGGFFQNASSKNPGSGYVDC